VSPLVVLGVDALGTSRCYRTVETANHGRQSVIRMQPVAMSPQCLGPLCGGLYRNHDAPAWKWCQRICIQFCRVLQRVKQAPRRGKAAIFSIRCIQFFKTVLRGNSRWTWWAASW